MTPDERVTNIYLPDPVNDETLTMSGYDWWRYKAAIEAQARNALLAEVRAKVEGLTPPNSWKRKAHHPESSYDPLVRESAVLALLGGPDDA